MITLDQRGSNTGMRPADSYCAVRERFLYAVYYTQVMNTLYYPHSLCKSHITEVQVTT